MRKKLLIVILAAVMLAGGIFSVSAQTEYTMTSSRQGSLRIGAEIYTFPLIIPGLFGELLQISPFGVTALYGVSEQFDVKATFAPFTYILLEYFPDAFLYVAEGTGRYHFSPVDSSFFVEASAGALGAYVKDADLDFDEQLDSAFFLWGLGMGFTFQSGDADISVGLNGYTFSAFTFPLPILKVAVSW